MLAMSLLQHLSGNENRGRDNRHMMIHRLKFAGRVNDMHVSPII